MTMAKTKEERFLIKLYEASCRAGDFDTPIDRYEVGQMANLHDKSVDTISNQLLQMNFIKKNGPTEIYLTPLGEGLVRQLLNE